MESARVKEGQYFYKGEDITKMQIWELLDALAEMSEVVKKMHEDHIKALNLLCGEG